MLRPTDESFGPVKYILETTTIKKNQMQFNPITYI